MQYTDTQIALVYPAHFEIFIQLLTQQVDGSLPKAQTSSSKIIHHVQKYGILYSSSEQAKAQNQRQKYQVCQNTMINQYFQHKKANKLKDTLTQVLNQYQGEIIIVNQCKVGCLYFIDDGQNRIDILRYCGEIIQKLRESKQFQTQQMQRGQNDNIIQQEVENNYECPIQNFNLKVDQKIDIPPENYKPQETIDKSQISQKGSSKSKLPGKQYNSKKEQVNNKKPIAVKQQQKHVPYTQNKNNHSGNRFNRFDRSKKQNSDSNKLRKPLKAEQSFDQTKKQKSSSPKNLKADNLQQPKQQPLNHTKKQNYDSKKLGKPEKGEQPNPLDQTKKQNSDPNKLIRKPEKVEQSLGQTKKLNYDPNKLKKPEQPKFSPQKKQIDGNNKLKITRRVKIAQDIKKAKQIQETYQLTHLQPSQSPNNSIKAPQTIDFQQDKTYKLQKGQKNLSAKNGDCQQSEAEQKKQIQSVKSYDFRKYIFRQKLAVSNIIKQSYKKSSMKFRKSSQKQEEPLPKLQSVTITFMMRQQLIAQEHVTKYSIIRNELMENYDIFYNSDFSSKLNVEMIMAIRDRTYYCRQKDLNKVQKIPPIKKIKNKSQGKQAPKTSYQNNHRSLFKLKQKFQGFKSMPTSNQILKSPSVMKQKEEIEEQKTYRMPSSYKKKQNFLIKSKKSGKQNYNQKAEQIKRAYGIGDRQLKKFSIGFQKRRIQQNI